MHPTSTIRRFGVLGALGLALVATTTHAQLSGVTNQLLGRGQTEYAAAIDGPADIALARVTMQPGSGSGWHWHAGPGWVVVTAGELSLYHLDRCRTVYPAGSAFLEEPGDVHDARNERGEPVEFLVAFTLPSGSPLLTPTAVVSTACADRDGEVE